MPNNTSDMIVGEMYGSMENEEEPSRVLSATVRDMVAERGPTVESASAQTL